MGRGHASGGGALRFCFSVCGAPCAWPVGVLEICAGTLLVAWPCIGYAPGILSCLLMLRSVLHPSSFPACPFAPVLTASPEAVSGWELLLCRTHLPLRWCRATWHCHLCVLLCQLQTVKVLHLCRAVSFPILMQQNMSKFKSLKNNTTTTPAPLPPCHPEQDECLREAPRGHTSSVWSARRAQPTRSMLTPINSLVGGGLFTPAGLDPVWGSLAVSPLECPTYLAPLLTHGPVLCRDRVCC